MTVPQCRKCHRAPPTRPLGVVAPVTQVPALHVVPEGQRKVPVRAACKVEAGVIVATLDGPQGHPRRDVAVGIKGRHAQVAVPVGFAEAWLLQEDAVLQGQQQGGLWNCTLATRALPVLPLSCKEVNVVAFWLRHAYLSCGSLTSLVMVVQVVHDFDPAQPCCTCDDSWQQ